MKAISDILAVAIKNTCIPKTTVVHTMKHTNKGNLLLVQEKKDGKRQVVEHNSSGVKVKN